MIKCVRFKPTFQHESRQQRKSSTISHFSDFSSSHSPTGLQMLNLALIPKQQEFKCPSSLTQKITFQGQTTFHSSQTRTGKDRAESQFSTTALLNTRRLHFHKRHSDIVGRQRQVRNWAATKQGHNTWETSLTVLLGFTCWYLVLRNKQRSYCRWYYFVQTNKIP